MSRHNAKARNWAGIFGFLDLNNKGYYFSQSAVPPLVTCDLGVIIQRSLDDVHRKHVEYRRKQLNVDSTESVSLANVQMCTYVRRFLIK